MSAGYERTRTWLSSIAIIGFIAFALILSLTMRNGKVKAQERIMSGAIECREKGGYLPPDRVRGGGVYYNCITESGLVGLSYDMHTGYRGLNINLEDDAP